MASEATKTEDGGIATWTGPITRERALDEILKAYGTMSGGRCGWAAYEAGDAAKRIEQNLALGSGPCHAVFLADHPKTVIGADPSRPEHVVTLCITGNGPNSVANAHGIIRIMTVLDALYKAGASATRSDEPSALSDLIAVCKAVVERSSGCEDEDAYAELPWSVIDQMKAALALAEGGAAHV